MIGEPGMHCSEGLRRIIEPPGLVLDIEGPEEQDCIVFPLAHLAFQVAEGS